jgi:hypothetical protein
MRALRIITKGVTNMQSEVHVYNRCYAAVKDTPAQPLSGFDADYYVTRPKMEYILQDMIYNHAISTYTFDAERETLVLDQDEIWAYPLDVRNFDGAPHYRVPMFLIEMEPKAS